MRRKHWVAGVLAIVIAGGAIGGVAATASAKQQKLTKVTLQLKWVVQTQFAGYYAAAAKGYYKNAGLDVNFKIGGPTVTPELVVKGKQADIGLDWLPNLFATREQGSGLVSVAQMFARSGMTELTWKSSGIDSVAKMRGKKVGVWCCGNQPELYAALTKNGIDPNNAKDVTIVNQPFSMDLFLQHQVDAAAAMTYNELAQVLETKNPATGKLYQMSDLNVFRMASPKVGTGMLEDDVFVRGDWLKSKTNQGTLVKFLRASMQGWIYCRSHVADCVNMVLAKGSLLPKTHQTWELNEINKLIWPNTAGIGLPPAGALKYTESIAQKYGVIKNPPSAGAVNYTWAKKAQSQVKAMGLDVVGKKFKPITVTLTEGGK